MVEIKRVFDSNALGGPELLESAQLGFLLDRDHVFVEVKLFRVEPEHLIPQLTDRGHVLSVFRPHVTLAIIRKFLYALLKPNSSPVLLNRQRTTCSNLQPKASAECRPCRAENKIKHGIAAQTVE